MTIRTAMLTLAAITSLAACGSQQRDPAAATSAQLTAQEQTTPAPAADPLPPGIPPPPVDLLAVGSQEARDDLYCSALIYAENPDLSDALAPVDEALLRKAQALGFIIGEAGINKLVEANAVHATHARAVADAYAAQVEKDMRAHATRLSLDACNARARAVPMPE
jgi:hypothetical protein